MENLKKDLQTVTKFLRNAVIESVNANYTEYVSLSTNLVGHDKDISALQSSFSNLSTRFDTVVKRIEFLNGNLSDTTQKLDKFSEAKVRIWCSRHILQTLNKLETLQLVLMSQGTSSFTYTQSFERLCCNWADLQWHLFSVYSELPVVVAQKDRINRISDSVKTFLEHVIVGFLHNDTNKDLFVSCLEVLAFFNCTHFVEGVLRARISRPFLETCLQENRLQLDHLETLFSDLITFVNERIIPLQILTAQVCLGETNRKQYDFVSRSFWTEFVAQLDSPNLRSLFTVADPATFHRNYQTTLKFVKQVEGLLSYTSTSVAEFRESPSYEHLTSKWNLAVYYQLRFQEICGKLESCLNCESSYEPSKVISANGLWLDGSTEVYGALNEIWNEETTFIAALSHRFWKLSLLVLHRYSRWISQQVTEQNS